MRENGDAHGRRALSLATAVMLLLTAVGCAGSQEFVDRRVGNVLCQFLVQRFGISQPGEFDYPDVVEDCEFARFFDKSLPDAEPFGEVVPVAAKVTREADSGLYLYGAQGKVKAGKFPKLVLPVPYGRLVKGGTGTVDVSVETMILNQDFEPAKKMFGSMKVVLRSVSGGTTTILGEASTKLTKKALGGDVAFAGIEASGELEAVVSYSGGTVRDATFLVSADASLAAAGPSAAGSPETLAAGRGSGGEVGPLDGAAPRISTPEWLAAGGKKVVGGPGVALTFYRAQGTVKAKKLPKVVLDLPPPPKSSKAKVQVDVGLTVMTKRFKVPKAAARPESVDVTLYSVKKNGKSKKLGKKSGKVDKSGEASLRFKKIEAPAKGGHLRVVLRVKGKKVENALILVSGSAA